MNSVPQEETDAYWVGVLSATSAIALKALKSKDVHLARQLLNDGLREFMRSPVPNEELRELLRKEMK